MKRLALILLLVVQTALSAVPAVAVSPEEKTFLTLYFSDDELKVVSATRSLKSVARIAENVSVVTADEIELMNAHTVADVLVNVAGIEMASFPGTGMMGFSGIHGSSSERVTVLLDGVPLADANNAVATGILPVQMIEKIEIIKGPASSTWGSSFGGVINIITRSVSKEQQLSGMVSASAGERNTTDVRADLSGRKGPIGLYLFAGTFNSDGLRNHHEFWQNNFFGKLTADAGTRTTIDLSFLYHKSSAIQYDYPAWDELEEFGQENMVARLGLRSSLRADLDLDISSWVSSYDYNQFYRSISAGSQYGLSAISFDRYGLNSSLTWRSGPHTIVGGLDVSHARYRVEVPFVSFDASVKQRKYAFFLNDTMVIDKWSITPGLRYEHVNLGGGILSPSLGITYQAAKDLLLKASVTRGYHTAAPGYFVDYSSLFTWLVNSDLRPEKIWSYQIGAEANLGDTLWLKLVLFRHDITDLITYADSDGDLLADTLENANKQRVYGGEMELKTRSFHGFVLKGGAWYEHVRLIDYHSDRQFDTTKSYGFNAAVSYDDKKGLRAILQGRYMWWNLPYDYWFAKYNGLIMDFSLTKEVLKKKDMSLDLFVSGHNLLNANSYDNDLYVNPRRWIEAGVRWKF